MAAAPEEQQGPVAMMAEVVRRRAVRHRMAQPALHRAAVRPVPRHRAAAAECWVWENAARASIVKIRIREFACRPMLNRYAESAIIRPIRAQWIRNAQWWILRRSAINLHVVVVIRNVCPAARRTVIARRGNIARRVTVVCPMHAHRMPTVPRTSNARQWLALASPARPTSIVMAIV